MNQRLAQVARTKLVALKDATRMAATESSFSRLDLIIALHPKMHPNEWLQLLGEWWEVCDNIWVHRKKLKKILGTSGPILEMMNDEEKAALAALPDKIVVHRGCGPENMLGASWTTSREVAERFPFLMRYKTKEPILVTATVRKKIFWLTNSNATNMKSLLFPDEGFL